MVNIFRPGKYRHYKGNEYILLFTATHSETLEDMIVYRAQYDDNRVWVRPASMWYEQIELDGRQVPRFTFVDET